MLYQSIIFFVACGVVVCASIQFYWSKRKLYAFARQLPGPLALPIIGNGLLFACETDDIYDVMLDTFRKYESPMRVWLGPKLTVVFRKLPHVERILSSTKITYKGDIYKFIACLGGVGLITGSGPKWKEHHKLIQPMLNLKFVTLQLDIMQKHSSKLVKNMEKLIDRGYVDVQHTLHPYFFDIIGECVCGLTLNAQEGQNLKIMKSFDDWYDNVFAQMMKPWLHSETIFNLTHYKKDRDNFTKVMRDFIQKAIDASRKRIKNGQVEITEASPIIDKVTSYLSESSPITMTDAEIIDHFVTLYAASEDTTTLITSSVCLCFGMYPEYQKVAAEEIRNILGETPREVTETDVAKMKYMEMCIKEALRLFPIAPFILRRATEEFPVGEYTIPVDCEVLIPIDILHRDPEQWSNPNHFHPDHFLPENVKNRHVYTYIPFSIGPRVCIGKLLSMQMLKICAANLLQHFAFEAEGKYPDLRLRSDISVRVKKGYLVKISKRVWK